MGLKMEYTLEGKRSYTLNEVRQLVEATADWPGGTVVRVDKTNHGSQREPDTATITVKLA